MVQYQSIYQLILANSHTFDYNRHAGSTTIQGNTRSSKECKTKTRNRSQRTREIPLLMICVDMRYDSEEYIHVEKPLSAVRRIYTMSRYLYDTMWQYAGIIRSMKGAWVILRRLWVTTVMAYTDTSCGHLRREWRGARSKFLGLIIITALIGYNGYFSRYFIRWRARINHGRIIHRP